MIAEPPASFSLIGEKALRRQIDQSVSRALVDGEYARLLLANPTVALEERGCTPQQFKSLRNIRATDLLDFARQVQSMFWIVEPHPAAEQAEHPLAAAAAF